MANASENTSVTMPVKMMPSERRTAIQLRSPPTIAALTVPTITPAAMGSVVSFARMRRAVATDPGQGADAEEELVRAPEDQVEADAVRREHERLHGQRRRVRRVAEPDRGSTARIAAVTTIGRSAQPILPRRGRLLAFSISVIGRAAREVG